MRIPAPDAPPYQPSQASTLASHNVRKVLIIVVVSGRPDCRTGPNRCNRPCLTVTDDGTRARTNYV